MLKTKKFQRKIEDFICFSCGVKVKGNGYTDHCPFCLWSCHIDINPGDRSEKCKGMMKPISLEIKSGNYVINYICLKCGKSHKVKAVKDDNFEALINYLAAS